MTRAGVLIAALLLAVAGDVMARGGGRGGGGFARGGVAAGGSFGQRSGAGGRYSRQGPAASGTFPGRSDGRFSGYEGGAGQGAMPPDAGDRGERQEQRHERRNEVREDWQSYGDNRREDWQDYADDHYDDHYDGSYYPYGAAVVPDTAEAVAVATPPYWSLDCVPATVVVGGTTYYRCDSAWYVRVYSGGDVAYVIVNPPAR